MNAIQHSGFAEALHSAAPAADRAAGMGLYAWLIGDWKMDVLRHDPNGATHKSEGSIHFGWVLEGRAIQDVWRIPGRGQSLDAPSQSLMYGTTLRIYDPDIDAWHIIWADPVRQYYTRQIGRAAGDEIVQEGTDADGVPVRWIFTEITPDSFHWIGEHSPDDDGSWRKVVEFFARRVSA